MTYQIPQQLEYKEKIMFGLTFKQLAYAFLFGFISIFFLKRVGNDFFKWSLAITSSVLGMCFMFLDLDRRIKECYVFIKSRKITKGDFKSEKFVGIKDVKDNVIINSKNKKVSVLKVRPINFSIKPSNEKDSIILSFQKFLNALDFPTQILMTTECIELSKYLDSLEKRVDKESFKELFEEYKGHLTEVIKDRKIMDRVFYLIIPEESDIEIQTEICIRKLEGLNLKVKRLKDNDLKKLLTKFYSGDGTGNLIRSISPEYINNHVDHLKTNDRYYRIVYASGYPRSVEKGFLDKIVSSLGDFDLSLHIKPYPIENMLIDLNKELQKQRADLYSMQTKGIINPSLEIQYKDTKGVLENLQKGRERLFNISLYVNCKADSLSELNLLTKKVEAELNSIMILPKVPKFRILQGFKAMSPIGIDELNQNRNITTGALSAFFPFTSQFLDVDETGIWLGLNQNNIPIIKDIFKLPNPNGLVLAQSGGGKSYFCKLLIMRYLLNGTRVMIIDPQGEYNELVDYFKGQRINLSRKSKTIINPLDLMGHEYAEKRLSLMDLMQVMLGKLTEPQKAIIDKALTAAYTERGITDNPRTWKKTPPVLGDVLHVLEKTEKEAIQLEKVTVRSIINRLDMYVNGVFKFLNQQTKIEFDNKLVCFDIGNLPNQVKPTIMFLVLDYVYMKMKSDLNRKILLIDESWSLLSRTEDAGYIFEIVKTCRKFNLGLLLINQEVEGLLDSKAGKSVLANSAYTLLMRQKPAVIDNIKKTFHLSNSEKTHLLTANVGEGLLIMEDEHSKIKVIASPEEHKIVTTNADEKIAENGNVEIKKEKPEKDKDKIEIKKIERKINKKIKKTTKPTIDVLHPEPYYNLNNLGSFDINLLKEKGYKSSRQTDINKKKETYLIKPRKNETPQHAFLVFDIANFLKNYTQKISLFETKKPDIVFELENKKYAIEVETGKITYQKKLKEKSETLKKDYGNNWFFVVTDRNLIPKYKKFGKVVDKRYLSYYLEKLQNESETKTANEPQKS